MLVCRGTKKSHRKIARMMRPAKGSHSVKMRSKIVSVTRESGSCTGVLSA
jgi:hypothetical protein